jgi:hypothetical protein
METVSSLIQRPFLVLEILVLENSLLLENARPVQKFVGDTALLKTTVLVQMLCPGR